MKALTPRALATVLAALRYWQENTKYEEDDGDVAMEVPTNWHFDDHEPLTPDEVDTLCEELNCTGWLPISEVDDDRRKRIVELTRDQHAVDGHLEIDDDATISEGDDNGCYVSSWVWCDFAGSALDKAADETA